MVKATLQQSEVCATGYGFSMTCADPQQTITVITFAAFGDPTQCPHPKLGQCTHPNSRAVIEAACINRTSCKALTPKDFPGAPSCIEQVYMPTIMATAVCSGGPARRANNLRLAFVVPSTPTAATVTVSALGYHVLHCNGHRVSRRVLQPGRQSNRRVFFSEFDLLPHLIEGKNVLTAQLGNGWSSDAGNQPGATQQPPSLYVNGSVSTQEGDLISLRSGVGNWRSNVGPVTYDSVYNGEHRDFREGDGPAWLSPEFDDSHWKGVAVTSMPCAEVWTGRAQQQCSGPKELTLQNISLVEQMHLPPLFVRPANRSRPPPNHAPAACEMTIEGTRGATVFASCGGSRRISNVSFAQYGMIAGSCATALVGGTCGLDLRSAANAACVNQHNCSLSCVVTDQEMTNCSVNGVHVKSSPDPCTDKVKDLGLLLACESDPRSSSQPGEGQEEEEEETTFLVDFGVNMAGVVRVKAPAAPVDGQTIVVRHCEVLNHAPLSQETQHGACWLGNPGINANQKGSLATAESVDMYILSANATRNGEWLQPDFTVHGFRYAEISGLSVLPASDVVAVRIGANITQSSRLQLSNERIQKVQTATVNTQLANTQDIFTDCPQRSERLGWLGDAAVSAEEANLNFGNGGISHYYKHFLQMIGDAQDKTSGAVPNMVPTPWQLNSEMPSAVSWGSAYPTIVHELWMTTGDRSVITQHLDGLVRYMATMESTPASKMRHGFGDWFPPCPLDTDHSATGAKKCPGADPSLCAASSFIMNCRQVSAVAAAVGNTSVHVHYSAVAERLTAEFNAAWLRGNSTYSHTPHALQTEVSLPLWLGIVPAEAKVAVVDTLVADIKANDYHVTTGLLGTRSVYEALAMNGRVDVALKMLNQTTMPSFGYIVENSLEPSSTLWEKWDAPLRTTDQVDSSRAHIMFGSISAFFWKYLVGLQPAAAGWQRAVVAPSAERCSAAAETGGGDQQDGPPLLESVNATLSTVSGDIHVSWQLQDGEVGDGSLSFTLNVTLPVEASVVVPCVQVTSVVLWGGRVVWRGGASAEAAEGRPAGREAPGGGVAFAVPAGHHCFRRTGNTPLIQVEETQQVEE